ncbi:hypothetical protein [Nocardioides sp. GY 10127]|uniref:DUF6912 family protein n=1 Tax=Nocardioides sp. GY 10127 TaxID=2569762 RepID=UPI0010A7965B|nr:hypothetical protein [Nocardioides sp. GY 10127]TIC81645.1 hypothetical protein E8D37_10605 [Nocardioides sp. GY 10127]
MSVRVYVPGSYALLAGWFAQGQVPTADGVSAVDDGEESEYAALMGAADASAELAGEDRRRVVVVAEVRAEGDVAALSQVAAVHVDTEPFEDVDDELLWFATQEVEHLLG